MRSYRSPKTEVRPSGIAGRGSFAKEPIRRGEVTHVRAGGVMTRAEEAALPAGLRGHSVQLDAEFFLCITAAGLVDALSCFLNHSCEANVGFRGQVVFVALRDIEPEEEMTVDYATAYGEGREPLACRCGQPACRGTVTGEDWRRPDLVARYAGHFTAFLQERIDAGRHLADR